MSQTMSKEKYEASRPKDEQRIEVKDSEGRLRAVLRVNFEDGREVKVFIHNVSADGFEELPLAYMLGTNATFFRPK
jgi:hypothetical protein